MTGFAAAALLTAALVAGWPARHGRARWAGLVGHRAEQVVGATRRRPALDALPPARAGLLAAALLAVPGGLVGGPVAATVVAVYGWLAARTVLRSRATRSAARQHRASLDDLCALAADLRAGLPAAALLTQTASAVPLPEPKRQGDDRLARLTGAAGRLAEQTGAPLAELVERIEADARAMDRARAAAGAQAAGARATGYLLAGLPIGGIALGYGIGVDPLDVLLRTPIGAACALGAVVLQLAGLTWTERLVGAPERAGAPAGRRIGSPFPPTGASGTPDRDRGRRAATRTGHGSASGRLP
ncbi:hypothetical protein AB0I61_08530 [Polymorphospora rubra]|uniref:type II secretion system F family protein n=1 Tax=Polymorphospora rubra TaxID=338584 RepID=UPI00340CDB2F